MISAEIISALIKLYLNNRLFYFIGGSLEGKESSHLKG